MAGHWLKVKHASKESPDLKHNLNVVRLLSRRLNLVDCVLNGKHVAKQVLKESVCKVLCVFECVESAIPPTVH